MHIAAENGQKRVVKLLLKESGCAINEKDNQGRTAVDLAYGAAHNKIVSLLTEKGAKINYAKALLRAAEIGNIDTAETILSRNCKKLDLKGSLLLAIQNGHVGMANILIDKLWPLSNEEQRDDIMTWVLEKASGETKTLLIDYISKLNAAQKSNSDDDDDEFSEEAPKLNIEKASETKKKIKKARRQKPKPKPKPEPLPKINEEEEEEEEALELKKQTKDDDQNASGNDDDDDDEFSEEAPKTKKKTKKLGHSKKAFSLIKKKTKKARRQKPKPKPLLKINEEEEEEEEAL